MTKTNQTIIYWLLKDATNNAITGAFAAGGGLSFFVGSALRSAAGAGAVAAAAAAGAAAAGLTGGSKLAGFVSDFAAVVVVPFSAAYIFEVWYVKAYNF